MYALNFPDLTSILLILNFSYFHYYNLDEVLTLITLYNVSIAKSLKRKVIINAIL